jgi:hypothetical protein
MHISRPISVFASGLVFVLGGQAVIASSSVAAPSQCSGTTFTVLHNDTSGGVTLSRGQYRITSSTLTCTTASALFKTFLEKYKKTIPQWNSTIYGVGHAKYTRSSNGTNFTVTKMTPANGGGGGGGGGSSRCTGTTFTVLHDDSSGGVKLPRGQYRITSSTLACMTASAFFKTFLQKYSKTIPQWNSKIYGVGNAKYTRTSNGTNFTVKKTK